MEMNTDTAKKAKDTIARIELAEEALKSAAKMLHKVFGHGKIKYGSIYLVDKSGLSWKIKVRWRDDRKNYLSIKRYPEETDDFKAAVGKKHFEKPWKYKELALEEWKVLAIYALKAKDLKSSPQEDSELKNLCTEILNDLVYVRKLQEKK